MTPECKAVIDAIAVLHENGPMLALLFGIAVAVLIWDTYDGWRRERICKDCGHCQTRINGTPDLPPPGSGVNG